VATASTLATTQSDSVTGGQAARNAEDDRRGAEPIVILAHGLWTRRYGADPQVLGRQVKVNGMVSTVVGVMPEGMQFPFNNEL
jgi:putative ABC transport system permease protein